MHNRYMPATDPLSVTFNTTIEEFTNTEFTLVTADTGDAHVPPPPPPLLEITKPDASPLTFTRLTPLTVIITLLPPLPPTAAGITAGDTDVTDTIPSNPAVKYSDIALQRAHTTYMPALVALALTTTEIPLPLVQLFDTTVTPATPLTTLPEHDDTDADTTNAPPSELTFGIHDPLTDTV